MKEPALTITPDSLLSLEAYAKIRRSSQPGVIAHRRLRTVHVGEHLSIQFEDEATIRRQIQEMLHIEKIFDEDGIRSEIEAYASLVPDGENWKATMLIEYPDPNERTRELGRLIGVEDRVFIERTTRKRRLSTSCASSSRRPRAMRYARAPACDSAATTGTTRRTSRSCRKHWRAWLAIFVEPIAVIDTDDWN